MLDFFRTANGSYNFVFMVAVVAWIISTLGLVASGHKHLTDTASARAKEKQAAEERAQEEQRRSEQSSRIAAMEAKLEGAALTPQTENVVPASPVNPSAKLSLLVPTVFLNMNRDASMFWIVNEKTAPQIAQPVNAAYVKIVNLGSAPVSIASYSLEERERDEWRKIWPEDTSKARIYAIGSKGVSEAYELDLNGNLLNGNLTKPIKPQQVAAGWLFFRQLTPLTKARFRVIDTLGQEVSATVAVKLDNQIEREGEGGSFTVTKTTRNLTTLKLGRLDE